MRQVFQSVLVAAVIALAACGRESAVQPGLPTQNPNNPVLGTPGYYDPGQGNTYTPAPDTHGYQPDQLSGNTYAVLKNVFLRMDPELGVLVRHLEGQLVPKRNGDPVIFDDVRSFVTQVARAEIIIDDQNITTLKNKYTFNFEDAPIKDVKVEFLPGRLKMSGKLKQVVWVPFSMEGQIGPTPDGKLKVVPDDIRTAGIPVKSLLSFLGLTTSKLVSVSAERGLSFIGNDVVLDPELLFPPPKMKGRVVAAEVSQGQMRIVFDNGMRIPQRQMPDPGAANFMHVYGGQLLVMNELHRGSEMQMVDMKPSNPFDFYMGQYREHLKAGYVKVANDKGSLITLMPDYPDLGNTKVWDGYPGGAPTLRPYQASTAITSPLR